MSRKLLQDELETLKVSLSPFFFVRVFCCSLYTPAPPSPQLDYERTKQVAEKLQGKVCHLKVDQASSCYVSCAPCPSVGCRVRRVRVWDPSPFLPRRTSRLTSNCGRASAL